jgi:prepilin-type N-terminal cleavage/methylation domain-containing protein
MRYTNREAGFTLFEILVTAAIIGIVAAIAVPMVGNAMASLRISGDAHDVSNATALAKMRAASDFTRARIYVDLSGNYFHMEVFDQTSNTWKTENGGAGYLSSGSSFSAGSVPTPPPNTQGTLGQAPACKNDAGTAIGNTACIVFSSRGLPIDSVGAPTAADAIYLTNGSVVYGITLAATGMIRTWRTNDTSTPSWELQ